MTDAPYERYKEALRLGHVAALHGRLREGPRAARVDDVAVSPAPFLDAKSFGIEGAW